MFLMTLQSTITKGLNSGVAMSSKSDITGDKIPFNKDGMKEVIYEKGQ